jgi:hypothetical protein
MLKTLFIIQPFENKVISSFEKKMSKFEYNVRKFISETRILAKNNFLGKVTQNLGSFITLFWKLY